MQSLTINEDTMTAIHYIIGSININTNADKVWKVLTDPAMIKEYIGSGKGKVLENDHEKLLKHTYLNNIAGAEDSPDNHSIITWSLENTLDGLTTLTYTRENIPTLEERAMFEEHLPSMLDEIKRLAEQD